MSSLSPQHICLLCNRSNDFLSCTTDSSGNIGKFIKFFQRFTEIGYFEKYFSHEKLLDNDFGALVNTCEECSLVIDQFCEIYHQLKCFEIQLEWKLNKLVEVVKLGVKVSPRISSLDKVLEERFKNDLPKISKKHELLMPFRQYIIKTGK